MNNKYHVLLYIALIGMVCSQCKKQEIPEGTFPPENAILSKKEAQNMVFSWTPVMFRDNRDFSYQLRVFKLNSSPENKDENMYPLTMILEESTLQPYLELTKNHPKLEPGNAYLWDVVAIDTEGKSHDVKNVSEFYYRDKTNRRETDIYSKCETKRTIKKYDEDTGMCIDSYIKIPCPGPKVHKTTGGMSSIGNPSALRAKNMVTSEIGSDKHNCITLEEDNKLDITYKYKISVPKDKFEYIGEDSVIFKIFENQIELGLQPDTYIIHDYVSVYNIDNQDFVLGPIDYELVCDENEPYYQAEVIIYVSLKVKFTYLPSIDYKYPKTYETVFDIVPIDASIPHMYDDQNSHSHENLGQNTGVSDLWSQLGLDNIENRSYQYYKLLDLNEDTFHEGQHIVVSRAIGRSMFCDYMDDLFIYVPKPIATPKNNGYN